MQSLVLIVCSMLPCDTYYAGKLVENDTSRFVEEGGGEVNCEIDVHDVSGDTITLDLMQRSVSASRISDPFIQSGNWFIAFTCGEKHSYDTLPSNVPFRVTDVRLSARAIWGTRVEVRSSSNETVPSDEGVVWRACFCRVDKKKERLLCKSNEVPIGRYPAESRFSVVSKISPVSQLGLPEKPVDIKLTRTNRNDKSLDWIICNESRSYAMIADPFLIRPYCPYLPLSIRVMPKNSELLNKHHQFAHAEFNCERVMVPPRAIIGVDMYGLISPQKRSAAYIVEASSDFFRPLVFDGSDRKPASPLPTIRFTLEAQQNP